MLIILPYGTQDTEPHTLIVPAHMIADQMGMRGNIDLFCLIYFGIF